MPTKWTDEETLDILDRHERQGQTGPAIAKHYGTSKSAIMGLIHRVRREEQPCKCRKPENKDGGMPERWWAR